ncbi:MAG: hypothetical protein WBA63_08310 [Thermomicrobiales bacterium]
MLGGVNLVLPNIILRFQSEIAEVSGDERLESLVLKNSPTGDVETVAASAPFVFIGASPRTEWLDGCVARDEKGFILTGPDLVANGRPRIWKLSRDPLLPGDHYPGGLRRGRRASRIRKARRHGGGRGRDGGDVDLAVPRPGSSVATRILHSIAGERRIGR